MEYVHFKAIEAHVSQTNPLLQLHVHLVFQARQQVILDTSFSLAINSPPELSHHLATNKKL
jgi:hypothetical protein